MKLRQILVLGLASACLPFAASAAAVCQVGSTTYETLQAGVTALASKGDGASLKLLCDITQTNCVTIPASGTKTIDGQGHTIRQGYSGRLFYTETWNLALTLKDVVLCGGGDTYAASNTVGIVLYVNAGGGNNLSALTFGSGCVVSNFVSQGLLLGGREGWKLFIKEGARVVYNTACGTSNPNGALLMNVKEGRGLQIDGGEIAYNTAKCQYLAVGNKSGGNGVVINGGDIHHNKGSEGVYYYNYTGQKFTVNGGAIRENSGAVFNHGSGAQPVTLTGGMIYGNSSGILCSYSAATMVGMIKISGDAVVAGNGASEGDYKSGIGFNTVSAYLPPIALAGDFTGYIQAYGYGNADYKWKPYHYLGVAYGTNLNNYAGAENIHQAGNMNRVLVTEEATGRMLWTDTKKAKIGDTEYATLAAALAAAADGAKIELTADACATATLVPPADKAITVDGKGYRIFRCGSFPLFTLSAANASLTVSNVVVRGGRSTSYGAHKSGDIAGEIVQATGAGSRLAFGPGVAFSDAAGTNGLITVASGSTVAFEGAAVTNLANKVVVAETGSTVELKGATEIRGNDRDIDVPDGNVLKLTGDLAGKVHVTVAGVEPLIGQTFGSATGNWSGLGNFVKPSDAPKTLHVEICGGWLQWCKYGFVWTIR